ncbi:YadA-like family protein [Acinetobacter sp. YH12237]|uniref:YadA-like family protein n=1 Tax=Acinetobacter sp. YH12237 TaxID=2601164 RepID=UPI0015D18F36|nr:YadA-like family protein [Acinetobacter sp. YH12237]
MKFQKTLLAASLAVAAVSANAAWVNPAQNLTALTGTDANAPVLGNVHLNQIGYGITEIDLGSGSVDAQNTNAGSTVTYEIFNYKTTSGADVISLKNLGTGEDLGYFYRPTSANAELKKYEGTDVDVKTLSKGGQLSTDVGATTTVGEELKVVNSEHVIYGYQGVTAAEGAQLYGDLITPEGAQSPFEGKLPATIADASTKYVQTGIIGNTGLKDVDGHAIDPSKNIYGVSAKDKNNITVLTGNGIALGDLSNGGQLHEDGRVVTANSVLVGQPTASQTLKSREYQVDNVTYVETFNDDVGNEAASVFYRVVGNQLVSVDPALVPESIKDLTPNRTGTASSTTGNYRTAWTKNTVTNQNVTYSEETTIAKLTQTTAGITDSVGDGNNVVTNVSSPEVISTQKQSVVTGIIDKQNGENVYGLTVSKEKVEGGETKVSAKTTITADYVDSGDFRINGVSIVDNIKSSVDGAVADASEAIDAKVAEVDQKIVQVDERLTQFNTVAAGLNSRVDQLNSRIDDVEKTAYRGVAIALAAQQQIPNIGAGQFAVFGGVGHYEGESAGALGVASVFADGRTSVSAALGFAGGNEVGGRVGVSYVFGGK